MPLTFITGPVRSGKSRFAEQQVAATGLPVLYLATARRDPHDPEWEARIAHHRRSRPAGWDVRETAAPGSPTIAELIGAAPGHAVLLDSVGTWLAAQMGPDVTEDGLEARAMELARVLLAAPARLVVVGEEVGWGIVPLAPAARLFRDVAGRVQQRLAREADRAFLVVAGYAIDLKAVGTAVSG